MSVALLPSSPALHDQVAMFAPKPSAVKRPKLSLNTTSVSDQPFRSKQSTSLRLDTLSATSPTARNTFGNAFAHSSQPSSKLSLPLLTRHDSARPDTPFEQSIVLPTSSPVSATCDIAPVAEIVPYTIGYDVSSILRNGPRVQRRHRHSPSQSKPIFALTKRVIFRAPLTEEVKNKDYTLRHSDLTTGSTTSAPDTLPVPATGTPFPKDDGGDADLTPATPLAGRKKTDRHWYWTIGSDGVDATDDEHRTSRSTPIDDTS